MSVRHHGSRGIVSRADLLRGLTVAPRRHLVLDVDGSGWFGYELQSEPVATPALTREHHQKDATENSPDPTAKVPLRMPYAWTLADRRMRPSLTEEPAVKSNAITATPLGDADVKPESSVRRVDHQNLTPEARVLPALRKHLGATRIGSLDLNQLTASLAAMRMPRRLPRRRYRRWHPDLVVVLDFCQRLWPYREDMHRLAEWLIRHCGKRSVSIRVVNHGPSGCWSDWLANLTRRPGVFSSEHAWKMPMAGTPVLIVSDLGLITGGSSPSAMAWAGFVSLLRQAAVAPLALAPIGSRQLDSRFARMLPIIRWSPDAASHPDRGFDTDNNAPDGLLDLLAMVATARRVDPPLLRAMRRLNPISPLDAGLEGAVWRHADVQPGNSISIRPQALDKYLKRFSERLVMYHAELDAIRRCHHAHLSAALAHEETLLWASHAAEGAVQAPEARQRENNALLFFQKLTETLLRSGDQPGSSENWLAAARGIVSRADETMGRRYGQILTELAMRVRARAGDAAAPSWIDPSVVAKMHPNAPKKDVWLVHDVAGGWLGLTGEPPHEGQLEIGSSLTLDGGGLTFGIPESGHQRWVSAGALPVALAPADMPASLIIETSTETITVAALRRPRGAAAWACDAGGLTVRSPRLAGTAAQWRADQLQVSQIDDVHSSHHLALVGESSSLPKPSGFGEGVDIRFGMDAAFGVYADLHLTTDYGEALQRFRWIEPGSFMMGSPEDEAERDDDEGPRHLVTLSSGFWLGATACSQSLWQAVMGENPNRFKGDDRPVENVSWEDVQGFLRKLEDLVPGCFADLPTEAEWEYACRAGTPTRYNFGDEISRDRVNYGGKETVQVGSLPPNAWGLHEMHGNVWEWCADGLRDYTSSSVVDPRGPEGPGAPRASRGGSWIYGARGARSAYRFAARPGFALDVRGFRLCLRSIEPSQDWPGGPSRMPPRDEAARASGSSLVQRLSQRLSRRKK